MKWNADLYQNSHSFVVEYGKALLAYVNTAKGQKISSADAYGGITEITTDKNINLYFQDGVNARYLKPGEKTPPKHQLLIDFDYGSALVCSVQMYGGIYAFKKGAQDENKYYRAAKDCVPILSKDFTKAYFDKADKKLSAKAFLATQQRFPGLGNGVLQDILFNAKIHPKTKIQELSAKEIDAMFKSVKSTIKDMTAKGGRNTEKDLFANAGGYECILSKNTSGKPCKTCKTEIKKETYLGGSIYYCPGCQKHKKERG